MSSPKPWTKDDLRTLRRMFPRHPTAAVAAQLGRNLEGVKKKAARLGLKKIYGTLGA